MDTLRQLAKLPSDKFVNDIPSGTRLQCISVRTHNNPTRERTMAVLDELPERAMQDLGARETAPDVTAALTLIKIPRDDNEVIGVPEGTFQELFNACRLDPRFLHLLRSNRYGLHYELWQRRHCYYIGTVLYSVMWTFNPRTRITRAILLLRESGKTRSFSDFQRILGMESARLHTPFVLSWVALVHLSNWVDLVTYSQLTAVRKLESTTGHGPYGGNPAVMKLRQQQENMEELSKASRNVGSVLVDLANQSRHVAIGLSIASHLMSATKLDQLESYTADHVKDVFLEQLEAFTSGIPSIKRSLTDSKEYILYIQERTRNQATVINSLLTHEDARLSIKLAQASKELAEAAKKDSAAMKTIAVMTMLFLPGTFFASLWAVPSLKWDQPGPVIQDNFWVYLVFTIPSTFVIFAVWFGLHRWRHSTMMPTMSAISSSSSSIVSSMWPKPRKLGRKGKMHVGWPAGSEYLPLAIGGTVPASVSMQHLNNDLPAPTSVPVQDEMQQAPYQQTSVPLYPFNSVREDDDARAPTSVPFVADDGRHAYPPTSVPYMRPYQSAGTPQNPPHAEWYGQAVSTEANCSDATQWSAPQQLQQQQQQQQQQQRPHETQNYNQQQEYHPEQPRYAAYAPPPDMAAAAAAEVGAGAGAEAIAAVLPPFARPPQVNGMYHYPQIAYGAEIIRRSDTAQTGPATITAPAMTAAVVMDQQQQRNAGVDAQDWAQPSPMSPMSPTSGSGGGVVGATASNGLFQRTYRPFATSPRTT